MAFIATAELVERAVEAMARYDRDRDRAGLDAVLEAATLVQHQRRADNLAPFEETQRGELARCVGDDAALGAALAAVPDQVRALVLRDLVRHAGLLARVRELSAPPVVQEGMRKQVTAGIASLDPATPLPVEEVPVPAEDEDGLNVHDWLHMVLRALRTGPLVGQGKTIAGAPAGQGVILPATAASGLDFTTYGMSPADPLWTTAWLPRPLHGDSLVVVGVGGGPGSFARRGDGDRVQGTLAAPVASLGEGEALVSFVGVDNDVDWPWED